MKIQWYRVVGNDGTEDIAEITKAGAFPASSESLMHFPVTVTRVATEEEAQCADDEVAIRFEATLRQDRVGV